MNKKEEILVKYLNEPLEKQEFISINNWLKETENTDNSQTSKKINDLIISNHFANLSQYCFNESKAYQDFEKEIERKKVINLALPNKLKNLLKYAAILIVALGVSFFVFNNTKSQKLLQVYVPNGENKQLVLGDGTKVLLNANSTIKYPKHFSKEKREVFLEGEAFFDVTENKEKPFIINLPSHMNIKVLGTTFNVKAYPEDSKNVTTLFTGKIELAYKTDVAIKSVLLPGNKANYIKTTGEMSIIKDQSNEDVLAWQNNQLVFNQEPLSDIINELNRFFNVEIKIKNKKLENMIFTADFTKGVTLQEVLHFIELAGNIKIE